MADHHDSGPDVPQDLRDALLREFKQRDDSMTPYLEIGKQHDHPQGMYGPSDEGALAFGVAHDEKNRKVLVDFGAPVAWMALDPEQARHLGRMLVEKAGLAEGEREFRKRALAEREKNDES